jgi:hypothetical protein
VTKLWDVYGGRFEMIRHSQTHADAWCNITSRVVVVANAGRLRTHTAAETRDNRLRLQCFASLRNQLRWTCAMAARVEPHDNC